MIQKIIFLFLLVGFQLHGTTAHDQKKVSEKNIVLSEVADNFYPVEEGKLYRTSQLVGKTLEGYIQKYGIKTIINLRGPRKRASWWKSEHRVSKKMGVTLINIRMSSSRFPSKEQLKMLLDSYDLAEKPMMIHCLSGVNRTGQAAALWIMEKKENGTREEALEQFDEKFGYNETAFPSKKFFIEHVWQGRDGLEKYNVQDAVALYNKQKKKKIR